MLEGFDDSYSENEDVPESIDDEHYIFMPSDQSDFLEV